MIWLRYAATSATRGDDGERLRGSRWRSSAETLPRSRIPSATTSAYADGLLTAATPAWLRAAAEQEAAADVDHLERLLEREPALSDLRGERLHGHDHDVQQSDAVLGQLCDLFGPVSASQDPGVDRGVEASSRGRQRVAGRSSGPSPGARRCRPQREASGPVRRVELDAEPGEVAGERTDPVAIRDR